jgi:hypothetical protein
MRMSDDELRLLMFGPNVTRSHMVWSAAFCPLCRQRVPVYAWEIDGHARLLEFRGGRARVVGGDARQVVLVTLNGRAAAIENGARQ